MAWAATAAESSVDMLVVAAALVVVAWAAMVARFVEINQQGRKPDDECRPSAMRPLRVDCIGHSGDQAEAYRFGLYLLN